MAVFAAISNESPEAKGLIGYWATTEDRLHADKRRNPAARHESLLARSMLRALLSHTTGQNQWALRPDTRGRLRAFSPAGLEGPAVSLSHTRGFVACAVSEEAPVGIDVERWRARDYTALADYAFGPHERDTVAHGGAAAFYRVWTLREAIAKAAGDGLFAHMDGNDCISGHDGTTDAHGAWQFFYQMPEADCSLAIAIKNQDHGPCPVWTNATAPIIMTPLIHGKI